MNGQSQSPSLWIKGPGTDLFFFSFGWILAFGVFVYVDQTASHQHARVLLLSMALFNFLHRHLTFPLVYGDPEQFGQRKRAYLALPIFFLALTLFSYFFERRLFLVLEALAILWTMYHTLMQKVGLLRIYSLKSGAGRRWVDKALVFVWLLFVAFHMATFPTARADAASFFGATFSSFLNSIGPAIPFLTVLVGASALGLTLLYLRQESTPGARFSWPKHLYVLSILMIYATFYYDIATGYVVFGFSHAIEYIAFVNVYARKKYLKRPPESSLLARTVRHQVPAMAGYCLVLIPGFVIWTQTAPISLEWYIVGSGFLHFIYDGWIWKVSKPSVGKPLGIDYPGPPLTQGAL